MPLTPEELKRKQTEMSAPAARKLIESIDAAMLGEYDFDEGRFIWNEVPDLKDGAACRRAVFAAYEAKGWVVEEHEDESESRWWEFTPRDADGEVGGK